MTTTLITGANKGIGFAAARQLVAAGHTVWIGARDEGRGRAAAEELGARFVRLDVTDDASVTAAVATIEAAGGLDVLVNNAGVEGRTAGNGIVGPAELTADDMREIFDVNVFGTVRVIHAALPLLQRSVAPVIVNVASGLASLAGMSTEGSPIHFYPGIAYPASKTVVNVLTIQYAKAFPGIRVNSVEPGFTRTDLNGNTGVQTPDEGAEILVRMAQLGADGPTGSFVSAHGELPW